MSAQAGVDIAVSVLRAVFEAAPAAYEVLRSETVEEILAKGRTHLPAPGAARAAVDSIFGPPTLTVAPTPMAPPSAAVLYRVAPTTVPVIERLLSSHVARETLTDDERRELGVLLAVGRAVDRGELAPAVPPVLDPPPNPFVEPSSSED